MSDTAQCAKCGYKIELHTDMLEMFYKSHDCEKTKLQDAIQRVRELHKPDNDGFCLECRVKTMTDKKTAYQLTFYPCPTIKALDGEQ